MAIAEDITQYLSAEKGGLVLGEGLVVVIRTYLLEVALVKDIKEVKSADLLDVAADAWSSVNDGASIPKLHLNALKKWVKGVVSKDSDSVSVRSGKGHGHVDSDDNDDDDDELFGEASPSTRDLVMLSEDKARQGLSGMNLLRLAVALELGRVPAMGDVAGKVCYKSDMRMSEAAKRQVKAGVVTLSKILSAKDTSMRRELQSHFGSLIREFSEMSLIKEASLITQWWSETQTISSEDKIMCEYITEYLRKYAGRGLPEVVDIVIATRVSGSRAGGGVSQEVVKELVSQAKNSLKSQLDTMKSELANLKSELGRVKSGANASNTADKLAGVKCHKCGEFGHLARNCPKKKEDKEEDKDDE